MPRRRETGNVRKRGRVWWIWYHHQGQRYDESTKQGDEREARRLLRERRAEMARGDWEPASKRKARTVEAYAEEWIAKREADGVRNVHDEAVWLRSGSCPVSAPRR